MPAAWLIVGVMLSSGTAVAASREWLQVHQQVAERIPDELKRINDEITFLDEVPDPIAEAEIKRLQQYAWQAETPQDGEHLRPLSPGPTSRMFSEVVNHDPLGGIAFPGEPAGGAFDEINLSSGEVRFSRSDFSLPSRGGLGFQFERSFRSFRSYDGPLGAGWDHNHNQRLIFNAVPPGDATRAEWHTGSGTIEFTRNAGEWRAQPGAFVSLQREGLSMVIRARAGLRYVFEQAESRAENASYWRIAGITTLHRSGRQWANQLEYRYQPGSDRLREVVDPFERVIRFGYSEEGRLTGVHAGQISVRFSYAEGGLLERVTHLAVALGVGVASDLEESFTYAAGASGGLARMSAFRPFGGRVQYEYAYEAQSSGVPSRVLSVQEADTNGTSLAKWTVSYAEQAQRRRATYQPPEPSPREVWAFSHGDTREMAAANIRMPVSRAVPGRKAEWRFEHNADGLVVQTVHPSGRRAQWNYDSANPNALMRANLLSMHELPKPRSGEFPIQEYGIEQRYHSVLPLPITTDRYEVDKDGSRRILETERFEYNEYGDMVCRTVGDLSSWTVYTPYGEPAIEVDGNGAMTGWSRFERFKEGEVSLAGGGLLAQAVMDAEPANLLKKAKQGRLAIPAELPERVLSAPPVELAVRYAYDDMGNLRHEQHRDYRVWHVPNKLGMFLAQYDTRSDLVVSRYTDDLHLAERGARFSLPDGSNSYRGETWPGVSGRFRVEEFHRDRRGLLIRWVRSRERFGNALPEVRYERFADGTVRQRQAQGDAALITSVDSATGWVLGQRLESNQQQLPLISKMEYDTEGNLISFEDDGGQRHRRTIDPFGRLFSEQTPDQLVREKFLDGAGRLIGERVISTDGVTRDESRSRYSNAGLPLLVQRRRLAHDDRGIPIIDEWLIQEQNEYDAAGRVIRTRSVHDESSTDMVYDGLGRLIEVRKPGGDTQQSIYAGERQVATIQTYADTRDDLTRTLANLTFYTARGEPWLQVPLAQPGEPAFDRATIRRFDRLGRVVLSATPGKTIQRQDYNSLDQIERTVSTPIHETPEVGALVSEAEYDVAGRKISTALRNRPLALIGPDNTVLEPRRADVPQVRRFEYDQFGRLVVETQPDGLRSMRRYGRGSMVSQISRTRHGKTETLRFDYDVMRRLTAVRDSDNQILQRFEYHPLGYVVRADDHTIPGREVSVMRRYDSFGGVLSERTSMPERWQAVLHEVTRSNDYRQGISSVKIDTGRNIPPFWHRKTLHADGQGRVRRMSLDNEMNFAEYEYIGPLPVARRVGESELKKTTELTPFFEVQAERWTRTAGLQPQPFAVFNYYHDSFGDMEAYDLRIPSQDYEATHLYRYDPFQRPSRQGVLRRTFEHRDGRIQYLDNDPTILETARISSMEYDAAGNRIHQYTTRNRDAGQHFSPAKPYLIPDVVAGLQAAEADTEMASDRLGSVAQGKQLGKVFDYDALGRMTTFNSKRDNQTLTWQVEYDALGRATQMTGWDSEDPDRGRSLVTLEFATDAFNRRVIKYVSESDGGGGRTTHWAFTTYEDMLPLLVAERKTGQREPDYHQYLWGPGQREAVMAILPKARVEGGEDRDPRRYHLHQNRQLNVFAATTLEKDIVRAFDVSDYEDFGESATYARITNVETFGLLPVRGSNIEDCLNGILDAKQDAQWTREKESRRYALLLTLKHEAVLENLNIWHKGFPNTFEVIIPDAELSDNESISRYMERLLHQYSDNRIRVAAAVRDRQYRKGKAQVRNTSKWDDPYRLDLGRTEGRHVLLVWDEPVDLSVIQFEVLAYNEPASSLAFAAAWQDAETGLFYQGARYRLPEMGGKFISPDPLGFIAGHNLYAYANNDPLTYFDPDGEAPHVLIGAGVGGALGAGFYAWQIWRTDEEWNWAKFGIYTGAGALSGAAAAATLGAATAWAGSAGLTATKTGLLAGSLSGSAGGGVHGLASGFGITLYESEDVGSALAQGGRSMLISGGLGAVGGAAGGAVLSQVGAGFLGSTLSGAAGGGMAGGIGGGVRDAIETRSVAGGVRGASIGFARGVVLGGAIGAAGHGVGRASGLIKKLPNQPDNLPDPRSSADGRLLVRTRSVGAKRQAPGHHVKPLALGGSDHPRNVIPIPSGHGGTPHPAGVRNDPYGTIYY